MCAGGGKGSWQCLGLLLLGQLLLELAVSDQDLAEDVEDCLGEGVVLADYEALVVPE